MSQLLDVLDRERGDFGLTAFLRTFALVYLRTSNDPRDGAPARSAAAIAHGASHWAQRPVLREGQRSLVETPRLQTVLERLRAI